MLSTRLVMPALALAGALAATNASAAPPHPSKPADSGLTVRAHGLGSGRIRPEPPLAATYQGPTEQVSIEANEDAFIASARSGDNFGGDSRLYVGDRSGFGATRSYVYFDLDDLEPNMVVLDGDLRLYQRSGSPSGDPGRDIVVRRVTSGWREGRISWSDVPTVNDDRLATRNLGTGSGWQSWGVGELVRRWWSERWDNQGVFIQGFEAEGSLREFDSREGERAPELELEVAIDDKPPVATMKPLPPFTNQPSFPLAWEGEDPEPATGIDFYRLWWRRGDEPWLRLGDDLTSTSATVDGAENGRLYGFRVDAVDVAGNEEPPGGVEAQTIVDLSAPISAMTPLSPWVRGNFVLNWSAQDFPQGAGLLNSGILHYDVQYSIGDGSWGDFALGIADTSRTFEVTQGTHYRFRVRAVDQAGNVELFGAAQAETRVDGLPPRVWFSGVSGIDNPEFRVEWHGIDPGGSGVVSYDVQYNIDEGPWQDWVNGSTDRGRDFSGEYGRFYAFRGRARDIAGNEGQWPTRAQTIVAPIESEKIIARVWLTGLYRP